MAMNTKPDGPEYSVMYGLLLLGGTVTEGVEMVSEVVVVIAGMPLDEVVVAVGMSEFLAKVTHEKVVDSVMK